MTTPVGFDPLGSGRLECRVTQTAIDEPLKAIDEPLKAIDEPLKPRGGAVLQPL